MTILLVSSYSLSILEQWSFKYVVKVQDIGLEGRKFYNCYHMDIVGVF